MLSSPDGTRKGDFYAKVTTSSSHVWMWELDHKQDWTPKNWCFWTVVLQKTLESPLDCKEIQPVHPKGNQPWIFIGRNDAEAEAPILWPPDVKSQLIRKDPNAWKDGGQEEKGVTEDEMVAWHHWLNRHVFEQTLGNSEGQESLASCSPWDCRVRHDLATEQQPPLFLSRDVSHTLLSLTLYSLKSP